MARSSDSPPGLGGEGDAAINKEIGGGRGWAVLGIRRGRWHSLGVGYEEVEHVGGVHKRRGVVVPLVLLEEVRGADGQTMIVGIVGAEDAPRREVCRSPKVAPIEEARISCEFRW